MADNKDKKGLNVPALRFPEFTKEWKETTLDNECTINPTSDKLKTEFIYVDLESVERGELTKKQVIEKENAPSRAQRVLQNEDILFQCVRPYQKNNYIVKEVSSEIQWVASTGYAQLRTDRNIPAFIYHLLNTSSFNKKVIVRCTGSSYPAINSYDLSKIHFYICGIDEQKRIADFLSLLDERIATQNKIIEDLKKLKSALYQEMFGSLLAPTLKLGQVAEIVKGKQVNGTELLEQGDYYVMNGGTFPSGWLNKFNTEANTISISEGGNSCGYVQYNTSRYWSGGHCYSLKILHPQEVSDLYLYHFLKWQEGNIMALRIGSGLPNIQKKDLLHFPIILPTIDKQKSIISVLTAIDAKIACEVSLTEYYTMQKDFLLHNLFI